MLKIKIYNEKEHYKIWDDFVNKSYNGTIFHLRKFINYHPKDRFNDCSLLIYDKDKLISVFPAAILEKNGEKTLKSHPGTSYGGPVIDKNISIKESYDIIRSLENFVAENNISNIEFRIAPKIYNKYPTDQLDFALVRNDYIREDEELSTCYYLPDYLNKSDDEILSMFSSNTRRNIKKSLKSGLSFGIIDTESGIKEFHDILTENLTKHNTKPVHSLDELIYLNNEFGDRINIFAVWKDKEMLSGTLVLKINDVANHIFYSAVNYNYQEIRPVNYGVFMLLKHLACKGDKYLNYGISTEDGGKFINWGLFKFKEGFAGHGILRTYWKKNF